MATFAIYDDPSTLIRLDDVVYMRIPNHNTFSFEVYLRGICEPFIFGFPTEEKCKEQYEVVKRQVIASSPNENLRYTYNND